DNPGAKLTFVCVLSDKNLDEAEDLVLLGQKLGVDGVGFIPVHGIGAELRPVPTERMADFRRVTARLAEMKERGLPVDNSAEYLRLYEPFVASGKSPLRCYAGYNSLAVDCFGKIFPCFPWAEVDRAVGNVRETPLRDFWRSRAYNERRGEIAACTECLWNCQTELNLLFD
ncbi:MAG: SPASM domain-containing protein, partial [Candidatus Methylomirabilis sp.]|nr:SPASM domain-containing protein [Deltaproteobacteria bacterium]